MTRLFISMSIIVTLAVASGCNSFADAYTGASYPKTEDAAVGSLDAQSLAAYQGSNYQVIGSATFSDDAITDKRVNKKARKAAMKNGADVVLVDSVKTGERDVQIQVVSHYDWEYEYDKKNDEWTQEYRPQYTTETIQVPVYQYTGVFLKSCG